MPSPMPNPPPLDSRQLFKQLPLSAMVADLERKIHAVNPAFEQEFGYRSEDVIGEDTRFLYPDEATYIETAQKIRQAFHQPKRPFLIQWQRQDASQFIGECLIVPILIDGTHQGFFGVTRDVTQAVNDQKALMKASEELRASNQDLTYFAHTLAHDLKSPLRKVAAFGKLLHSKLEDRLTEDEKPVLQYMLEGADRAQTMIDAMLEFAKYGQGTIQKEKWPLKTLINEVCEDLGLKLKAQKTTFNCVRLEQIYADRNLMWQVFQNLLSNSLRYKHPQRDPKIQIEQKATPDETLIIWRDNGTGFDPLLADAIFDPFRSVHAPCPNRSKSTGMGLTIVKRIITQHGGRIWAESKPDVGTSVMITLPQEGTPPKPHAV